MGFDNGRGGGGSVPRCQDPIRITHSGGLHLCARIIKTAYVTLNEFRNNRANFLYVVSIHLLFRIDSYSSS